MVLTSARRTPITRRAGVTGPYRPRMASPSRGLRATALIATAVVVTATAALAVPERGPGRPVGRAVPQVAPELAITADGEISDIERLGDRIYVRGSFSKIGPFVGSGMPLDPVSGERIAAPLVDGQISVAVPDGSGGWYVGGDFEQIGDVRTRGLARLDAGGNADPGFAHRVTGLVSAMALHDGTLWIGGDFTKVDGYERHGLAAVSTSTGDVTAFAAPQQMRVTELTHAEAAGGRPARLYVGTDRVVALDPQTGAVDGRFSSGLRGDVRALLVEGGRVYVGGAGLAALDADTGDVDATFGAPAERFPSGTDGTVHTLLASGGRLYAGGDFSSLGGSAGFVVSLDPDTGEADDGFAPLAAQLGNSYGDRGVFDLAMAGDDLWAGGAFQLMVGESALNLVALDPVTGDRRDVPTPVFDHAVNAVDASGDGLYVGGQFYMLDPHHAPGFAALDAETLLPIRSFNPRRHRFGSMLAGNDVIYTATTHFEGYGRGPGKPYYSWPERIRAVDPETGASLAHLTLDRVKNLSGVTTLGDELYVGQRLENDKRFPRTRISVYSQATGDLVRRFRLPHPGYVAELSSVDGNLLAVGSFRRWRENGQPAHLAAMEVDPLDGRLRSGFDLHTHGPIYEVEQHGGDLYVAGMFDSVNTGTKEVDRNGLAAFDRSDGGYATLVRQFTPPRTLKGSYYTRLVGLGDSIVVMAWRKTFLDASTGSKLPDPTGGYGTTIDAIAPDPAGLVYSATIPVPIAGSGRYYLSFISRATG